MKICTPTEDDGGLKGRAHAHFGSAPYFTLVDTQTGDVEVLPNQGSNHAHGTCNPLHQLQDHTVDAVVCRGMGRRALAKLKMEAIEVRVTQGESVADILQAVKSGESKAPTDLHACRGHVNGSGCHGTTGPGEPRRHRRHGG